MPAEEWTTAQHVHRYLDRADEFPCRTAGESVLLEHVPRDAGRILDLGTGDGRLLRLLQSDRPGMLGVGLDFSELMLRAARERCAGDEQIELVTHDLAEPLPNLGRFDPVVSSMAIHHLEHERKRSLYREVSVCSTPVACSRTSSMSPRQPIACMWRSSRRSASRLNTKTRLTA